MKTMNEYCKEQFGEKLYKLSLSGPFTCPTRDGSKGYGGCIFCSEKGSGDFAGDINQSISDQIEAAKAKVKRKFKGEHYIAYFQAFTSTYAPAAFLESLFLPVIERDDIKVLSIATRPDCLPDDVLELLGRLNQIKPVWVELGFQTSKPESVDYIRRRYDNADYDVAVKKLNALGIHTITHIILGLPGESKEDMMHSVKYAVNAGTKGIKLQLLHVLKGTDMADDYAKSLFKTMELDDYIDVVKSCVGLLPKDMVVHRITGDGPKSLLIAPTWSGDKKRVLNAINKALAELEA